MDFHVVVYMGLALAYFEAALHSVAAHEVHCACRAIVIALLYASIAFFVFNPNYVIATASNLG